jgi:hypothetical protein
MQNTLLTVLFAFIMAVLWLLPVDFSAAHHVLGRPAYSLNEDSNTPPDAQAEIQVGDYLVTSMVFPAFARPGDPGRINLYISRIDDGTPFQGKVTFTVRDDSWLSWAGIGTNEETLGSRSPDDNVFRQRFLFREVGDYIVTAQFKAGGEPYTIDFPLRVGEPAPIGPIGVTVAVLMVVLVSVSVIQRQRSMTGKIRGTHAAGDRKP